LIRAAADGNAEVVEALLAEGTDVNARFARGQTALMLASIFGHEEIVTLLLRAGANTEMKDSLGLTAREWSVRRGFSNITQLIEQAPQPKAPPANGNLRLADTGFDSPHKYPSNDQQFKPQPEPESAVERPDNEESDGSYSSAMRLGAAGLAMLK